ncbi:FkbM family methyltransferase [Rhodobacterales bacterium HKCCSP123]|nr:FkbM family methyltransferase [Rhodobacterales bacterium HKCCSP123]
MSLSVLRLAKKILPQGAKTYVPNWLHRYYRKNLAQEVVAREGVFFWRTSHGVSLLLEPSSRKIDRTIIEKSFYEKAILELLQRLSKAGGVFWDVGANIGIFSTHSAHFMGFSHTVAFEPDPENFFRLVSAVRKNKLEDISLFNVALGSELGVSNLFQSPTGDGGLSSLENRFTKTSSSSCVVVPGDLFKQHACSFGGLSVVKIDVEGFELQVIRGSKEVIALYLPVIIIEVTSEDAVAACFELRELGYEFFTLSHGKGGHLVSWLNQVQPQILEHDNAILIPKARMEQVLHDLSLEVRVEPNND